MIYCKTVNFSFF